MKNKLHPIIKNPFEYEIIGLNYQIYPKDSSEPYLELSLKKNNDIRNLRFYSPVRLIIEEGFPNSTHGMEILDISSHQLEGLNVWVRDFEASKGSITFYAREVIDLDKLITK